MHDTPPRSVCFSLDDANQGDDDASELTGSCHEDAGPLSAREDGPDPAGDSYFYVHALDMDGSRDAGKHQELLHLKVRLARQQETLMLLSAKLDRCKVENEELRAERNALLDDLAAARRSEPEARRRWSFTLQGGSGGGGSLNMLIDTNARLMTENARLEAAADATRKSFRSYIEEARDSSERDRRTIDNLQRERDLLQRRLGAPKSLRGSTRTAKTSLDSTATGPLASRRPRGLSEDHTTRSSLDPSSTRSSPDPTTPDENPEEGSIREDILRKSLRSIPERVLGLDFGTSGDDWLIDGEDIYLDEDGSRTRDKGDDQMGDEGDNWTGDEDDTLTGKGAPRRPPEANSPPQEPIEGLEVPRHAAEGASRRTPPPASDREGPGGLRDAAEGADDRSELLVDFNDGSRRPPRPVLTRRLSKSHNDGKRPPDDRAGSELLVDFGDRGETRGGMRRRWSSMKY